MSEGYQLDMFRNAPVCNFARIVAVIFALYLA
jgi:hypothetical protein